MKSKEIWTNYKIYAFILGIVTGTIVYNLIGTDFSFSSIGKIKGINFWDSFIYLMMINLKFWIIIFLLSFLKSKSKSKIVLLVIFIQSFFMAGFITITILTKSYTLIYEIPMAAIKIGSVIVMLGERKMFMGKLISFGIIIAGTLLENIFFIKF